MTISLATLRNVLQGNVAEIKFARRAPKPGAPSKRRMICTTNYAFLNSAKGRTALNFKPTHKSPKYNPVQKNLLIVWDIFMHDYRSVNMDSCELVTTIPANEIFW